MLLLNVDAQGKSFHRRGAHQGWRKRESEVEEWRKGTRVGAEAGTRAY